MSSSDLNPPPRQTAPKVFISYRRRFDQGFARLLRLEITKAFGDDAVFRDVEDIAPGDLFPQRIEDAVKSCDTFLALISPGWLETSGSLHNPDDFVRLEIAAALGRKVRVIPLLLNGAQMPRKEDLPDDLAGLTVRQAIELSDGGWDDDVRHLLKAIRPARTRRTLHRFSDAARTLVSTWPGRAALAVLLLALLIPVLPPRLFPSYFRVGGETPTPTPVETPTPAASASPALTPTQEPATTGLEECFRQVLPAKDRWIEIEYGHLEYQTVIRNDQPKDGAAGILFVEDGRRIGAIRFRFIRSGRDANGNDSGFFKVEEVVGPGCRPVEDYSNATRGGPKGRLANYDYLDMTLDGRHYFLRLGYWKNAVNDNISARFHERTD